MKDIVRLEPPTRSRRWPAKTAQMLDRAGRVDEAIAWYRNAADTGDIFAPRQAARMLQKAGRIQEALSWYDDAASGGDPDAMRQAIWMLKEAGQTDEVISCCKTVLRQATVTR